MQSASPSVVNTDRFLELLRRRIRDEGRSLRSVSRSLGWHEDYLSQIFRGTPRLRIDQLFQILHAIEVSPADLFAEVADAFGGAERGRGAGPESLTPREVEEVLALVDSRIEAALDRTEGTEGSVRRGGRSS